MTETHTGRSLKILVLYATTGGNTALVAEAIAGNLRRGGHGDTTVQRVEQTTVGDIEACEVLVWGSPTYGHGQLDPRAIAFVQKVVRGIDLRGKPCAVFGLGDPKYDRDHNIESAVILTDFVEGHGGVSLIPPLKINRTPVPVLQTLVADWCAGLLEKLAGDDIQTLT